MSDRKNRDRRKRQRAREGIEELATKCLFGALTVLLAEHRLDPDFDVMQIAPGAGVLSVDIARAIRTHAVKVTQELTVEEVAAIADDLQGADEKAPN